MTRIWALSAILLREKSGGSRPANTGSTRNRVLGRDDDDVISWSTVVPLAAQPTWVKRTGGSIGSVSSCTS
jgi:hypothetical protein